jgi:uncharacterized membrane protein
MNPPAPAKPHDSRLRSIAKAISWRCVGTIDTFFVSFVVLTLTGATKGNTAHTLQLSGGIASVEVGTKIALFYLHERAWQRIKLGQRDAGPAKGLPGPTGALASATCEDFRQS